MARGPLRRARAKTRSALVKAAGLPITRMLRARARKNQIRPSQGSRRSARAKPGSPITRMSRGARAQKPDPPVSRGQAARTGDTRFAHNKDVTGRVAREQRARAQKRDLPVSRRRAARAGITRFAHHKDFARCGGRAARAQKPHQQYPVRP